MATYNETVKESIEIALTELMKIKPYAKINIKEITEKAGVSRVSFYRNFSSKEDILLQYIRLILSRETETEIPDKDIRFRFRRLLFHLKKHQSFFKLLEKNDLSWMIHYCATELSKNYIHKYQPAAVAYQDAYYAGGTVSVILQWMENGMKEDPDELAQIFDTLYFRKNFQKKNA